MTDPATVVSKAISDRLALEFAPQPVPATFTTFRVNKFSLPCGIVIDTETGEVTIPDGLELTEAAKAFWTAVERVSGYRAPGFW